MARLALPDGDTLRTRFAEGGCSPGTFLGLASPVAAEVAAQAGVDWVVLDLEHGGVTSDLVGPTVTAAAAYGVPVVVRVPSADRALIGWLCDQGVAGVMVPRIESLAQAKEVSSYFDYPPVGQRGVASYTRAARWGSRPLEDLCRPVFMPQIETPGALEEVGEIAALNGVDALFIGPLDLSYALNVPAQLDNASFISAFDRIIQAAQAHSVPVGSIAADDARAASMRDRGVDFLALGSDGVMLRQSLSASVEALVAKK